MNAALRTTKSAVFFPCLPPFPVLIDNIQNLALGERDLVGVIWRRSVWGTSPVLAGKKSVRGQPDTHMHIVLLPCKGTKFPRLR